VRPRGGPLLAVFWAGLSAALATAVPPAAPFLLAVGAARLSRSLFATPTLAQAFGAAAAAPIAALVLAIFISPGGSFVASIEAAVFLSLPALALLVGARDGRRKDTLHLLVSAVTALGGLAILLGFAVALGKDPGALMARDAAASAPELIAYLRSAGWAETDLVAMAKTLAISRDLFANHLPGIVLALSVFFAAVVVYPLGFVADLAGRDLAEPSFSRFRTPLVAAALFVPLGLAVVFAKGAARHVAVDLLLPIACLFFLRGLAIIRALLDRARFGLFVRAIVYALVSLFPVILALGGLFDEFLDIRARLDRSDTSGADST